ncbi:hypothetical protein CMO95_00985 [Candidatus Woesearchaeota archaeon]|nr:hypothetical protein [Candidatus Woesearchaeota archaeon]
MNIYSRATNLFGKYVNVESKIFRKLKDNLKKAKIKTPVEAYGSLVLFVTVSAVIVSLLFLFFLSLLTVGINLSAIVMNIVVAIFVGVICGAFTYYYPSFIISEKKGKIENSLAFVSIYMSTLTKSGFQPQNIFKMLSKFNDYPAAASEARKINHEVNKLGMDLRTSLEKAIARSPSPDWTEFLSGIKNSIETGGNLDKYLEEKSKGYTKGYKRKLESFGKTLTLLMNLYITVIIVGTIFFIIVSSLMGAVGGIPVGTIKLFHYITVFGGLPLVTAILITLVKSASPWSE